MKDRAGRRHVSASWWFASLVVSGPVACMVDDGDAAGSGADTDVLNPMDDPFPGASCATDGGTTGSCETTGATTSGTTSASPDQCSGSDDCPDGQFCAAQPDASDDRLSRRAYVCEAICIDNLDDDRWCSDDASCCDAEAQCTARGYCVVGGQDGTTTGTTGSTSSSGSTGGTGDGSTGGSSTGS